jgi:hypothetical protein
VVPLSQRYISPWIWRLSEDLDFVYLKDFRNILKTIPEMFGRIEELSGGGLGSDLFIAILPQ